MLPPVAQAIETLRHAFPDAAITPEEDGAGGAYVFVDPIALGEKFQPGSTWIGAHIPPQFPYADIYPLFIGADVRRASGIDWTGPITGGHVFRGRSAIQISRRTNRLDPLLQTAASKFQKVLFWLNQQA